MDVSPINICMVESSMTIDLMVGWVAVSRTYLVGVHPI